MVLDLGKVVRSEFPAVVGDPGKDYIFADAPTGTQVSFRQLLEIKLQAVSRFL